MGNGMKVGLRGWFVCQVGGRDGGKKNEIMAERAAHSGRRGTAVEATLSTSGSEIENGCISAWDGE